MRQVSCNGTEYENFHFFIVEQKIISLECLFEKVNLNEEKSPIVRIRIEFRVGNFLFNFAFHAGILYLYYVLTFQSNQSDM